MGSKVLEIDGSYLEGGGQILRNALSFSCILRCPIRITKIRANRPNPGLSNQHLFGLNLLKEITGARVSGNFIKSTEIEFDPCAISAGKYFVDTHTAASITLVIQAALPALLFGSKESELELIGGTNVGMAPQVDFMTEVLRPNLEMFGVSFDFDLIRRGYYPRGGGRCKVSVRPVRSVKPADLTRFGTLSAVSGWCFVAGRLPLQLADEMKTMTERKLKGLCQQGMDIMAYKESADIARDNGSGIILKAETSEGRVLGADALAAKQVNPEALADKASSELRECLELQTCVDCHVQDQLILFMTLASGTSRIRTGALTNHTLTAIHVAELMTGVKFQVEQAENGHCTLTCNGIGHINKFL